MATINKTTAPAPSAKPVSSGKKVMVYPGVYVQSAAKKPAKTKLGMIARQLAEQTAATTLSVAATTGYVYALTEAACPVIQFQDVPPGMPQSSLQELQSSYTTYQSQFALFQGQAGAWINTQQSSGAASIFSQLVSLPATLQDINGTVTSNFTLLNALPKDSPGYKNTLAQQTALIGAETSSVTQLITVMQALGTNLSNAATTLVNSADTGILNQMLQAYQTDIQALTTAINNANATISSDNKKIIGEGFGAAVSIGVGIIGLLNIWNPLGWIMLAGGAVGAYFAITEIEVLKAQIAELKAQIQTDTYYKTQDQAAASVLAAFCNQLKGFSAMNSATQAELTALENLYSTLSTDIAAAVADLNSGDLADAQSEWNEILAESAFLANLGAYLWPSSTELGAPSMFAAIGNDIYSIAVSGEMYHYSSSTNSWTDMSVTSLSCVGSGTTLVAIDGSPINGSATGTASNSTFYVKTYNMSTSTWSTISSFPAACIATGNGSIFAINQTVSDRQVYQYSGSGTTWTKLAALPGPDAAMQIAVANGTVFALTCNSQSVYQYNSSSNSWTLVGPAATNYTSISANGNKLAMIDTSNNAYLYDPTAGGNPAATGTSVSSVAQLSNGNQFQIGSSSLSLSYVNTSTNPATSTTLESNATSTFVSDTDIAYYGDNQGNLYLITTAGQTTQLPALPSNS